MSAGRRVIDWRAPVGELGPAEGHASSALARIDAALADEEVLDAVLVMRRDVCDEGHLHADLTVWLLTATRLISTEVNDARHLHAPTPGDGTSVHTVQVPLRAIADVTCNSWVGEDGDPVSFVSVAHRSGRGGGAASPHRCDDPECQESEDSLLIEMWDETLEIIGTGADADAFLRFAGLLGRAAAAV